VKLTARLNIFLYFISISCLIFSIWLLSQGALIVGANGDEERETRLLEHVNRARGLETDSDILLKFNFGLAFQWLGHIMNLARENESFLQPAFTTEAISIRHLISVVIAILAVMAVGLISWLLTRSFLIALLGCALLVALPLWAGHGMMNQKDIPVATGFTLVTAGLTAWLVGLKKSNWFAYFLIPLGFALAAGVRPAMWVVLTAEVAICAIVSRLPPFNRCSRAPANNQTPLSLVVGVLTGILLMILANPHLNQYLPSWPFAAVAQNREWHAEVFTLTRGQLLSSLDLPASYQVTWFIASTPVVFVALALIGAAFAFGCFANRLALLMPLIFQATALPVAFVAFRGTDYDGFRHHLYIYPALAVFASLAWFAVQSWDTRPLLFRLTRGGIAIITFAAILESVLATRLLWPYSFVYVNPLVVRGERVSESWEIDYFGASLREAVTHTPANASLRVWGPYESFYPYEHLQGSDTNYSEGSPPSYWWIKLNRFEEHVPIPEGCVQADAISRSLWGKKYEMAFLYRCQ
jgi:hypothetical protein